MTPLSINIQTRDASLLVRSSISTANDSRRIFERKATLHPVKHPQYAGHTNVTMAASDPCSITPIATETDFEHYTSSLPSSCLAVIYFHAPWAEPCKQMSTILSTLASTYNASDPPRIAFLSLDAEEVSEVSEKYDVTQVPLVVLQKDGQVVEAITGTDASKVRNAVEKHAGSSKDAGKAGLPPAQKVTKPMKSEPLDQSHGPANGGTNGDAGGGGLSKYAPDDSDPATAPQYSSGEKDGASKDELNSRLSELVKAARVMLFMKGTPSAPQCGFSRQTVSMLRDKGVRYGFFNILADDEVRQGLKEYSEWPTFPQVYVGGELVGGLDIVSDQLLFGKSASLMGFAAQGRIRERPRLSQRLLSQRKGRSRCLSRSIVSECFSDTTIFQNTCCRCFTLSAPARFTPAGAICKQCYDIFEGLLKSLRSMY